MQIKISTLCIPHIDGKLLLGRKKRDFGIGRWNGFGGKVKENESLEEAFRRELKEECGIIPVSFEKVGHNTFEYLGKDEIWEVHIYKITKYEGVIEEFDEMEPKWFLEQEIPYSEMWPDDEFWMPYFLQDKKFRGKFKFQGYDSIIEHTLELI